MSSVLATADHNFSPACGLSIGRKNVHQISSLSHLLFMRRQMRIGLGCDSTGKKATPFYVCLQAYAYGCLAQTDGPVIPIATILSLTLGGSREAVWEGLACGLLSLLNMASWWLQGPSVNVCTGEALPPSEIDPLSRCHGPLLQSEALPRWHLEQCLASGPGR